MNNSSLCGRKDPEPTMISSNKFSYVKVAPPIENVEEMPEVWVTPPVQGGNTLISILKQSIAPVFANRTSLNLLNELRATNDLDYESFQEKMKTTTGNVGLPNFNLESDVNTNIDSLPELADCQKQDILAAINTKIKKFSSIQKQIAIERYHEKKSKRKSPTYIRYKIRQDLAGQRVRNKGKFVKNRRLDLQKAAELLERGELTRARAEGADEQNAPPLIF
jgi:hypothetical protein